MTDAQLNYHLRNCGKGFFVEFFPNLNSILWTDSTQVHAATEEIFHKLMTKQRPDGRPYTLSGLAARMSHCRYIFLEQQQWAALRNITHSKVTPKQRQLAHTYLSLIPSHTC